MAPPKFRGCGFTGYSTLKIQTSLNKESRPVCLGDNSIWSFPLFLCLAKTAFGGPEGYSSLATIRTRRIGANPEKSDLVNFRGPD